TLPPRSRGFRPAGHAASSPELIPSRLDPRRDTDRASDRRRSRACPNRCCKCAQTVRLGPPSGLPSGGRWRTCPAGVLLHARTEMSFPTRLPDRLVRERSPACGKQAHIAECAFESRDLRVVRVSVRSTLASYRASAVEPKLARLVDC